MTNYNSYSNLHPWGVVMAFLMDLSSDDVCRIIDFTGLQVDWSLTSGQNYSHTTRNRAYRSKIQQAYERLYDDEKLMVTQNVATQLAQYDDEFVKSLNNKLHTIGWKLESGRLTTDDIDLIEMFFPKGTEHDAYIYIRKILRRANSKIAIIDPYLNDSILENIGSLEAETLQVKILSYKFPSDFLNEVQKFKVQYPGIDLHARKTKEFHDRFIIVDEKECYHIGASIKDAGNKAFMISQIEDSANIKALISQFSKSWQDASIHC